MFTTESINQSNQIDLPAILLQMSNGTFVTQTIYVAAKLGIADLLKDGAKSSDELATLTDVDAESLYPMLRTLSSIGIFAEGENQQFQLTPLAEYLQTDIPGSMRAFAMFIGEPWHLQVWGDILHSVKTGKIAFENVYGMEISQYLTQHPEVAEIVNKGMTSLTSSLMPAVLASYNFSPISKIVDVGGGHGLLIAEILKANPTIKGILFDQPPVVKEARHLIEAKGVEKRCEIVGGNFFESVPSGGDAYILKSVIHDWDAERAQTILKNCHQAMAENTKLLLLEKVIPPVNQPSMSQWLDLEMFVMGAGRERTEIEYRELLAAAGFMLTKVIYTQSPIDIIEAVKV
ncbi:methyltransferase [Nostoc commune]|uniref:methyltransferase n=1 Tax=Nostoc commune TaxID=1178 RepID=UPI0018C70EF5|nr:methyltransferase [Nostoc commune]MBG1264112.1 methyltransferase [Nostoc commune BAE]